LPNQAEGTAKPSLLRSFFEDAGSLPKVERENQVEIIKDVAGVVFAGA